MRFEAMAEIVLKVLSIGLDVVQNIIERNERAQTIQRELFHIKEAVEHKGITMTSGLQQHLEITVHRMLNVAGSKVLITNREVDGISSDLASIYAKLTLYNLAELRTDMSARANIKCDKCRAKGCHPDSCETERCHGFTKSGEQCVRDRDPKKIKYCWQHP